ncbi:MAG: hypothetical protein EA343_21530 [Nodularia sp. (in: Bacteria)]|nr:MAG: hypothetical protein EA343_21530 [Nodularia sp. (in: cyanobacteria)]
MIYTPRKEMTLTVNSSIITKSLLNFLRQIVLLTERTKIFYKNALDLRAKKYTKNYQGQLIKLGVETFTRDQNCIYHYPYKAANRLLIEGQLMERIIRSNAVATLSQRRSLEMKFYDFYFYYYLDFQMVSTYSSLVAAITMNLPKINILVCLLPQPLIFLCLFFKFAAKTLMNSFLAKLKRLRQLLKISEVFLHTC